jgi:uncharacterized protein YndB with AHSA1/START domain
MPTDPSTLTISRLIKAPPAVVWRAWSEPDHLAKWWIPAPIECQVVKLDLRPGGGFVTQMREGDGPFQPHVTGCFLDIVPQQRLVFTTVLAEGWQPFDPWIAITAIMTLRPTDSGTLYAAEVLHGNAADAAKHDEMGFQMGWGIGLAKLAALVEPMS